MQGTRPLQTSSFPFGCHASVVACCVSRLTLALRFALPSFDGLVSASLLCSFFGRSQAIGRSPSQPSHSFHNLEPGVPKLDLHPRVVPSHPSRFLAVMMVLEAFRCMSHSYSIYIRCGGAFLSLISTPTPGWRQQELDSRQYSRKLVHQPASHILYCGGCSSFYLENC